MIAFLGVGVAQAQGSIEITDQKAEYLFNDSMQFTAQYQSTETMIEGFIFYQEQGEDHTWVYEGELSDDRRLGVQVELTADNSPKAFSNVEYWFRFASDHGDIFESQHYNLYYEDNRYVWQTLDQPPFTLFWHNGDQAFAETILAAAQQGVTRARALLPLPNPLPITFQVYDNPEDVQLVAHLAGYSWLAGHTDPKLGIILLSLPPGAQQSLEIQRQVPHELAHILLYQALGDDGYSRLPVWLNEGIATNAELYSDPLQTELLQLANSSDTLLPFISLCKAFPQDGISARLAYAQSASFVRYMYEQYNSVGFGILVDAYAHNEDCLAASVASFGKDLLSLESDWRSATFDSAAGAQAWLRALPWPTIFTSALVAIFLWALVRRQSRASK